MAGQRDEQRGGDGTIEHRGLERWGLIGGRLPTFAASHRPQQHGQNQEQNHRRRETLGGIAHEQDDAHPPVGSLVADVAKNLGPRTPRTRRSRAAGDPAPGALPARASAPGRCAPAPPGSGTPPGRRGSGGRARWRAGQEGLLRRLDRREDPGDLLEDRLRRIRRPRGVLGLGPRLLRVGQAGQAFLELRGSLREPTEPSGQRALPLHPEFLRSLEPLERRLPPQNAQRPLELQLETKRFPREAGAGRPRSRGSGPPAPRPCAGVRPPPWRATPPPPAGWPPAAGAALLAELTPSGLPPRCGPRASAAGAGRRGTAAPTTP